MFYRRLVATGSCVVNFVGFALVVQMEKFDSTELSDQILFVSMLRIWNLRYCKHFWIIKCVLLRTNLFVINLNIASSSKVFSIFYYVYIDCIANLNQ